MHIIRDGVLFILSLGAAYLLVRSDLINNLHIVNGSGAYIAALVVGLFFSTVFTTAPAIVILGKIALYNNLFAVALFGAIGALIGDLILINFVQKYLRTDLFAMVGKKWTIKLNHIFHKRLYHRLAPLFAALIIASPFPDEPALALVGLDSRKENNLELMMFLANFFGVLMIGLAARAVT
jgi:hypothetical protein